MLLLATLVLSPEPLRILFLGNSLLNFNDVPT